MADNRPIVYQEGGGSVYRASALGSCIVDLVAARQGIEADPFHPKVQAAMDESSELEAHAIEWYEEKFDTKVVRQQEEVELLVPGGVVIRGHIEGTVESPKRLVEGFTLLEVKWFGDDLWEAWSAGGVESLPEPHRSRYCWQGSIYLHATGAKRLDWVVGHKRSETISVWSWLEPMVSAQKIIDRVERVEAAAQYDIMLECEKRGCYKGTPYYKAHPQPDRIEVDDEAGLESTLAKFWRIRDARDELDSELKIISDQLKEEFGPGIYEAGSFQMELVAVAGARRLDSRRIRAEMGDDWCSGFEKESKPTTRLTVKEKS